MRRNEHYHQLITKTQWTIPKRFLTGANNICCHFANCNVNYLLVICLYILYLNHFVKRIICIICEMMCVTFSTVEETRTKRKVLEKNKNVVPNRGERTRWHK